MAKVHTSYPIWPPCDKGEFFQILVVLFTFFSHQLFATYRNKSWLLDENSQWFCILVRNFFTSKHFRSRCRSRWVKSRPRSIAVSANQIRKKIHGRAWRWRHLPLKNLGRGANCCPQIRRGKVDFPSTTRLELCSVERHKLQPHGVKLSIRPMLINCCRNEFLSVLEFSFSFSPFTVLLV